MNRLTFPNDVVRIDGALDLVQSPRGVSPRRLPAWTGRLVHSALLAFDAAATAGVRLAFRTSARTLSLTLACEVLQLDDIRFAAAVDLLVDGRYVTRRELPELGRVLLRDRELVERQHALPAVLTFDLPGSADKQVELWLPHTATSELIALEASAAIHPPRDDRRLRWIHYGSSISHCLEGEGPSESWPALVSRSRELDLINLGFAGAATLDPFVAGAIRDAKVDLISIKVGVNLVGSALMSESALVGAVDGFLDTIREGHPKAPILVVSALYCPELETTKHEGELSLAESRHVLSAVVDRRRGAGDGTIGYLDGLRLMGTAEGAKLGDGVHPDPAAYPLIAARFAQLAGWAPPQS